MKNRIRLLAAIIILFVVFTICYFVIPFPHKSTAVFVLMYIFTAIAIIAQLYPLYVTFFQTKRLNNVVYSADKYKKLKNVIYGLPLVKAGLTYLIIQLVLTLIVTVINCFVVIPVWIIIILLVLLLGYTAINFITKHTVKDTIEDLEEKTVVDVVFIENFRTECAAFLASFSYEPLYEKVRELKELVQYSDPVTHESLNEIEDEISTLFIQVKDNYYNSQFTLLERDLNKLISLVKERNVRCKLAK